MSPAIEQEIKKTIGYEGSTRCCKTCRHFVPDNYSGSMHAKSRHCTFNPSFDLPVDEGARCTEYQSKRDVCQHDGCNEAKPDVPGPDSAGPWFCMKHRGDAKRRDFA